MKNQISALIIILLFSLMGCKKDSVDDAANNNNNNTSGTGEYPDAFAILAAATVVEYVAPSPLPAMEVHSGTLSGLFGLGTGATNPADAGTVKLDTTVLYYNATGPYYPHNNGTAYIYNELNSVPQLVWDVTGNSANSIAATNDDIGAMPVIDSISSPSVINAGGGYNFICTNVINADSIIFKLSSSSGSCEIVRTGSASSVLFDPADIGKLGFNKVTGEIHAKTVIVKTVGGKKYYFIKDAKYVKNDMKVQ